MPFDRATGLGGSDMAAVMGVSPWRTRLDVWLEKTRNPMWVPQAESPAMRWGKILEPVIREQYTLDTGLAVVPAPPRMTWEDEDLPWWSRDEIRFGHPDGLVLADGVWEGKTGSDESPWEGGVPIYYRIQTQQYMDIFERAWTDVTVLLPGGDFRTYREPVDFGMQLSIAEEAATFWRYVTDGTPPDPLDAIYQYPIAEPEKEIAPTEEIAAVVLALLEMRESAKAGEADDKALAEQIRLYMKDAHRMKGAGWSVTLGNPKPPQSVGWEQVATSLWNTLESLRRQMQYGKEPLPDDIAQYLDPALYSTLVGMYTVTGKITRPLTPRRIKS